MQPYAPRPWFETRFERGQVPSRLDVSPALQVVVEGFQVQVGDGSHHGSPQVGDVVPPGGPGRVSDTRVGACVVDVPVGPGDGNVRGHQVPRRRGIPQPIQPDHQFRPVVRSRGSPVEPDVVGSVPGTGRGNVETPTAHGTGDGAGQDRHVASRRTVGAPMAPLVDGRVGGNGGSTIETGRRDRESAARIVHIQAIRAGTGGVPRVVDDAVFPAPDGDVFVGAVTTTQGLGRRGHRRKRINPDAGIQDSHENSTHRPGHEGSPLATDNNFSRLKAADSMRFRESNPAVPTG